MKITAIMPTRGRRNFILKAISCFMSQTHLDRELVIMDDEDDPSLPLDHIFQDGVRRIVERIRYNIPEKLNRLCSIVNSDLIVRFDDDDWSHPRRIETQIARMIEHKKSVTGYHSILFVDDAMNFRKYVGTSEYACGSSMMFTKEFWKTNRFNEKYFVGSDNVFSRAARDARELISVDAKGMLVARAHAKNTSRKEMFRYSAVNQNEIPAGIQL